MNVNPPTELRDRHREDAESRRRSQKKKKKKVVRRSSHHKKKKKSHRSRRSSHQYTETDVGSAWTADDENRLQVALWIGESSRAQGGTSSPQEAGSGAREAAENGGNASSADGDDDGEGIDEPHNSKQPKKT
ncbi:hypothetical protein TrVGV298_003731 [Trichoderma virens]|nr:hypothetical protein TrVGV298_003731 [Trichoderma virens]UKZ76013.1 hypothetical protein TrVFT333_003709 [Trichoderma virens FT-333]